MYSMMANLTRHLVSSAHSTMAGNSDWDSWPIPITAVEKQVVILISKYQVLQMYTSYLWCSLESGGARAHAHTHARTCTHKHAYRLSWTEAILRN